MRKKAASVLCSLATLCAANVSSSSVESRAVASPSIWPSQTFVTEDFTAPNMTIIRSGDTVPGYLFLTPAGNGTTSQAPILISDSNELIWSGPAGGWVYNGFRVQDVHNEPHLSYWKGNSSATFGHGYGSVHVLNSSYHEVYNICPSATELDLVTPGHVSYACYLDMHEASITNQDTLLATAYNVTQADLTSVGGPKNGWIFDSLFFEIDLATGKVLFRWRSLDHLPKIPLNQSQYPLVLATGTFGTTQILPWDYFHINSVQALPDGYLVNSRHLFSTYKISKNGSIDWHLSGSQDIPSDFTLPPSAYFSWQHDPRIYNATKTSLTITYFNNDNSEAPGQNGTNSSTGLNLSLDLASHSVTLLRKFTVPHAPIFADSQGSYQPLPNGHALLGYGQVAKTREFNASGNLVYEAQYGYSTAISQVASYRSYRQTWSAQPATAPKLVAKCSDGTTGMTSSTTKVYLSWNGATTYDSWNIFAGNSTTDLSAVASIPKTGFETEYVLEGQWKYVLAEAKDGHRPLRNASIVSTNCSW
jgi:hypothetical protein